LKLLISGGLGHIGSGLMQRITKDDGIQEILIIDSLMSQRYVSLFNLELIPKIRFIPKQISEVDESDLKIIKEYDYAIHLAAMTDAANSFNKSNELIQNNLGSTNKMIEMCGEFDIRLIFPSSTSVYGSQELEVNEECTELTPQSPYAECKLMEENAIKKATNEGLKNIVLRFGTIHGISNGMRFHTAVNKFCFDHALGNTIKIWSTAYQQYRPYLALSDACLAIKHVISKDLNDGQIYNIVTDNYTIKEIVNFMESVSDKKIRKEFVDSPIMNQLSYKVNRQKFQATGFEFKGSITQDISDTLKLFEKITNE
jgi:UDP-glucose 4-epimerase